MSILLRCIEVCRLVIGFKFAEVSIDKVHFVVVLFLLCTWELSLSSRIIM